MGTSMAVNIVQLSVRSRTTDGLSHLLQPAQPIQDFKLFLRKRQGILDRSGSVAYVDIGITLSKPETRSSRRLVAVCSSRPALVVSGGWCEIPFLLVADLLKPLRSRAADCALRTLKLDGNKAGDQPITVVLKALVRHQSPVSHLGLADNRLMLKTMQVRSSRAKGRYATSRLSCLPVEHISPKDRCNGLGCEARRQQEGARYKFQDGDLVRNSF